MILDYLVPQINGELSELLSGVYVLIYAFWKRDLTRCV
jgi:hypothetical protein